jgi:hypothetical protein
MPSASASKKPNVAIDRDLINNHVDHVEVQTKQIAIKLVRRGAQRANRKTGNVNTTFILLRSHQAVSERRALRK